MEPLTMLALGSLATGGLGSLLQGLGQGKEPVTRQIQRFNPQQQQGINASLEQALAGLSQPLGSGFDPIAQQARTQFGQQGLPSIAERFSGLGAGSQRSSAFGQSLGQGMADLEGQLASQRGQFGLQERNQFQNLLNLGLTPQYDTLYEPSQPGGLQRFGAGLSALGGQTAGPLMQLSNSQQQNARLDQILNQLNMQPQNNSFFSRFL